MLADLRHRHAVGKQPDTRQHHALTSGHGRLQAIGIIRLHANDLDLRAQVLHIRGDPGDQPTATARHENSVERPRLLAQDLHGHRALPGDGVRVIVGMDIDVALLIHQLQ